MDLLFNLYLFTVFAFLNLFIGVVVNVFEEEGRKLRENKVVDKKGGEEVRPVSNEHLEKQIEMLTEMVAMQQKKLDQIEYKKQS